jgi:hypothetical protein
MSCRTSAGVEAFGVSEKSHTFAQPCATLSVMEKSHMRRRYRLRGSVTFPFLSNLYSKTGIDG